MYQPRRWFNDDKKQPEKERKFRFKYKDFIIYTKYFWEYPSHQRGYPLIRWCESEDAIPHYINELADVSRCNVNALQLHRMQAHSLFDYEERFRKKPIEIKFTRNVGWVIYTSINQLECIRDGGGFIIVFNYHRAQLHILHIPKSTKFS